MAKELPLWRSLLFVPVIVERFIAKAASRGADAIILDLEDAVPAAEKARARTLVPAAAATVGAMGADVLVRPNRPWRLLVRDLEAVIGPAVAGLMLPKIESAEHLRAIAEIIDELEAERGMPLGHTKLVAMLETPASIFRAEEVAKADPRLVGLTVGAEDLALASGMLPEAEGLLFPKQRGIFAARAAGILPLGFLGTVADYKDLDRFRLTIRRSCALGFAGAAVIHPSQIAILNEEFSPSAEEVERARRVVAAYETAGARGLGAISLDGRMIDAPVVRRAEALLARHAALERKRG